jgi:hypothetical protein
MQIWRLYDTANKMFFNDLGRAELLSIIDSIPPTELRFWHVCKDDEPEWFPLAERIGELKTQMHARPEGIVSLGEFVEGLIDTKSGFTRTNRKPLGFDKRKSNRHQQKIMAYIDVGDDILSAHTKDISLMSIKFTERFSGRYGGRYYPITLKTKPAITLRGIPRTGEKEQARGNWSIINLDPNFNLKGLANYLGEEILIPKMR